MISSNGKLLEFAQICDGFLPVDMQTAANNGDWVSLKLYERCLVIFFKGVGTSGDNPVYKIQQATVVAGSDAKDMLFTEIWKKSGTLTDNTTNGKFTKVTQAAATSYTGLATAAQIVAIDIGPELMDIDNGFLCIQGSVADVGGNAQLGCCLYLLYHARDAAALPASAIID